MESLSAIVLLIVSCLFLGGIPAVPFEPQPSSSVEYWTNDAQQTINNILQQRENRNIAKNIILFMGDGMSVSTVAMARVYAGGESTKLSFESFPFIGMSKTYCVNKQVPDSACSGTAYLTGVKGNYETIGVNAKIPSYDCTAELDESTHTYSIAQWAIDAGKDAGLVTTTRVTHASPASVYAHTSNRDRENDNEVKKDGCDPEITKDIAMQLIYGKTGQGLKVVLGGGRREFLHKHPDPETGSNGKRKDSRNLIEEWLNLAETGENRTYVWNRDDLLGVDPAKTDRLLGMFEPGHCVYNLERIQEGLDQEPTLAEMVDKATDVLRKSDNGFFLFVEGGRIDHAHHRNWARLSLDETVEFSKAVELARSKFSEEDTLIIVTSDHSHAVTYSGYSARGSDILGAHNEGNDGLPYKTVNYANGLGFYDHVSPSEGGRVNVEQLDTLWREFRHPATLPLESETHGGEDVAVYASGPWSHLFKGTYEQNAIPHMLAYASCIGDGLKACS
ncbi:membrane-bound alkaline phosphatase-like [Armigeres subalbatus]|uniref:membrane-bound alkaline phosphatase-like n=1 Tax=Armigeres subalbatus TaxID=124917 RepID=UPI002ED25440